MGMPDSEMVINEEESGVHMCPVLLIAVWERLLEF